MGEATDTIDIDTARRDIHEALDGDGPVVERYRTALSIGCRYLGVENGHLKEVPGPDGKGARISVAAEDVAWIAGDTTVADAGFCKRVVDRDRALGIADAVAEGYDDDPGYADHGVRCYLAARVEVAGDTYGTACFVSQAPRDRKFTTEERLFVELFAQLVGRHLEKRHHLEALSDSQSKYEALVEAAPGAVLLLDAEAGTVVETNAKAAALTGYDGDALVGRDYSELLPVGDAPGDSSDPMAWFLSADGPRNSLPDGSALTVTRADGTEVPVEVTVEAVPAVDRPLLQTVVRDIRDRRERERRVEAAFDATFQFQGLLSPDGTLLEANETAVSIVEADRDQLLGKPFWECAWWQIDEATREQLRGAVARAADGEFVRYETEVHSTDGPLPIDFSLRPVTDDDGEVELIIPEGRDISDRIERERQLAVLSRILRHNFRNTLTVMAGALDRVRAAFDGAAPGAVDVLQDRTAELTDLMDDYRETVELLNDPPARRPVAVDEVVRSVAARVQADYPQATIAVDCPGPVEIQAIPEVGDALEALLENAVEHGGARSDSQTRDAAGANAGKPPGTDAREAGVEDAPAATASPADGDGDGSRVEVVVRRGAERVTVAVSDDGPGLPDGEARILEGDQQVDPLTHGTGMGLWRTYWLLDLSDADATVEAGSEGTTIELSFEPAEG